MTARNLRLHLFPKMDSKTEITAFKGNHVYLVVFTPDLGAVSLMSIIETARFAVRTAKQLVFT